MTNESKEAPGSEGVVSESAKVDPHRDIILSMLDLLAELLVYLLAAIWSLVSDLAKGIWRAVNVWRSAPEENHTPVEYLDALLFPEDNPGPSDSPHPQSIYRDNYESARGIR